MIATVDLAGLEGDPSQWGFQVVVQSNEGFPAGNDLLTRKVNEYEGQHRFGGGNDGDCDPHAIDILAGAGKGDASEVKAQHDMLSYECAEDGTAKKPATLTMVGGTASRRRHPRLRRRRSSPSQIHDSCRMVARAVMSRPRRQPGSPRFPDRLQKRGVSP